MKKYNEKKENKEEKRTKDVKRHRGIERRQSHANEEIKTQAISRKFECKIG